MPIPKPKSDESKSDFISRCMGDDVMVDEFPDESQRRAVCESAWDEKSMMKRPTGQREERVYNFEKLKVEERSDGLGPMITGYAAVFNKLSEDLGGFREKIKPGAFKTALKNSDARGLFNHDSNFVLGRQSNGTLRIKEDKNGLFMEIDPPDTQMIRDLVLAPIRRGDIREQSFGFIVKEDNWDNLDNEKKDKPITRTIVEVQELFDVSPVTFPAYPDTSVALRSLERAKEPMFKPADIADIIEISLRKLKETGPHTDEEVIFELIKNLLPILKDEQRQKLIPTSEPERISPGDDDGIDDEITHQKMVEDVYERYKHWKLNH